MVSFKNLLASALAVSSCTSLVAANPIEPRAGGAGDIVLIIAGIVKNILGATKDGTEEKSVVTYDIKKFPQFCDLYMETKDGGRCYATVECKNGWKMFYKKDFQRWDHCWVGGTTRFEDPRIGKFEIQFRTRDGYEGQGLTEPIFRLESVQNWKTWDVTALSIARKSSKSCEKGLTPLNCNQGPFLCHFVTSGNANIEDGRLRRWSCGVPMKGENSLDKLPELQWPYLENGRMIGEYRKPL